jgi:lysophospholipase L1-like esterase
MLFPVTFWQSGASYAEQVQALAPIAYWPMDDASGTVALDASGNGRNGAYRAAGEPLLGQSVTDAQGTRFVAPLFDGSNDYLNLYSTSFRDAFNGAEGSVMAWFRVADTAVWADGTTRRVLTLFAASGNEYFLRKETTGTLPFAFAMGGTVKSLTIPSPASTLWQCVVITWSKTANQIIVSLNGAPVGSPLTSLGTWAGTPAATQTMAGASSTSGAASWSGNIAHVAYWNRPLTANEVATLAQIGANVALEGDSITVGYAAQLPPLMASRAGIRSIATGGETVATMNTQIATQLRPLYRTSISRNIAVLLGGTNDAAAAAPAATIYSRISAWHAAARAEGFRTLCCTITPRGDNATYNTTISDTNALLRADHTFADGFLDVAAISSLTDPNDTTYFNADKLHLTTAGYGVLAAAVAGAIAAL